MSDKIFYTMGEVAEMFDVNASLIRYWGTQFSCLKPQRNKKGNRLFSKSDIETLKLIYHYVKERGMTLEGAKRALRGDRSQEKAGSANVELMERLQSLRSMLIAVRDSLDEQAEVAASKVAETATAEAESTAVAQTPKPAYREQTLFDW
jgi:DNA-binding transcriptional MerR regulator